MEIPSSSDSSELPATAELIEALDLLGARALGPTNVFSAQTVLPRGLFESCEDEDNASKSPEWRRAVSAFGAHPVLSPLLGRLWKVGPACNLVSAEDLCHYFYFNLRHDGRISHRVAYDFVSDLLRAVGSHSVVGRLVMAICGLGNETTYSQPNSPFFIEPISSRHLEIGQSLSSISALPRLAIQVRMLIGLEILEEGVESVAITTDDALSTLSFLEYGSVFCDALSITSDCICAISAAWLAIEGWPWNPGVFNFGDSVRMAHRFANGAPAETEITDAFDVATKLLNSSSSDKPSLNLRTSVHRFAESSAQKSDSDSLLDLMIAAEAALIPESTASELSFRLALRCAWLVGQSENERSVIFETIREAYGIRSKAAHGAKVKAHNHQLTLEARKIIKKCIRMLLSEPQRSEKEWQAFWSRRVLGA